jgi:uncharacterized protein
LHFSKAKIRQRTISDDRISEHSTSNKAGITSTLVTKLVLRLSGTNMSDSEIQLIEQVSSDKVPVHGYLHLPANASGDGLVLTHGAGANCQSTLLTSLAAEFCQAGMTVLRCDLPFRQMRQHGPPPRGSAERDQQGLCAAIAVLRTRVSGRVFLGGHSYGGRQASMLAASESGVADALLLLSYPLHPPKQPDQIRAAHFPSLQTPALFVHGARDNFGSRDEMLAALKLIPATNEFMEVDGAGHELINGRNREQLTKAIVEKFHAFVSQTAPLLPR